MQTPLHGIRRQREKRGDLRDRPLLEVVEAQHGLKRSRQLRDGPAQALLRVAAFQRLGRMDSQFPAMRQQQRVQFRRLCGAAAALLQGDAPGAMAGNGMEPAGEFRRMLQLGQRLERQQKCLLRHVFRRAARSQNRFGNQRHAAAEPPHQRVEGVQVAQQRQHNQLFRQNLRIGFCRHSAFISRKQGDCYASGE